MRPIDSLASTFRRGARVAVGPSGSGKTTLLSALAGLLTPTSGSIRLDDVEVTHCGARHSLGIAKTVVAWCSSRFQNLVPS